MRSAFCRWERNEISRCHSRRAYLSVGRVRFWPGMFDVLQHRKGDLSARSTRDQPGRADTLISPTGIHDPRRVGGISLRKEARSRASPIVWIRRFSVGNGRTNKPGSVLNVPLASVLSTALNLCPFGGAVLANGKPSCEFFAFERLP